MSTEFFNPEQSHEVINNNAKSATQNNNTPQGIPTDVDGVFASATKDGLPVFEVPKDDFYRNMKSDRKRIRFSSDTPAAQYLRGTRYNNPFFVQTTDDNGSKYLRKVK
jgi:hypothetical protein